MRTFTSKILMLLVALFLLALLCSQAYMLFQEHYETETAVAYNAKEQLVFKGVYVRDETVVTCTSDGIIGFSEPDGSKVAKGSVVASVYESENDIRNIKRIKAYQAELDGLVKAQNQGTVQFAQPDFLSSLISERYQSIAEASRKGDFEAIAADKAELTKLLNIMKIAVKEEQEYTDRMDELELRITELKETTSGSVEDLTVDDGGYFVSYVDGYEDTLTFDSLDTVTVSQIENVNDKKLTVENSDYLGKIISGYEWKMVGIIDNSAFRYASGQTAKLKIPSADEYISVLVEEIRPTDNPKESIIILSSDRLSYPYVQHRCEHVELVLNDFEGLKVPHKAIRFLNGEKGVYVQLGQQVIFKKIDVIYDGGDYVLSKKGLSKEYLQMYEDIVIEGIQQLETAPASTSGETTSGTEATAPSETAPETAS